MRHYYQSLGLMFLIGVFLVVVSGCKEMERAKAANDASYHVMENLTQQGYIWHLDHVRREHARRLIEDAVYNACDRSK